ncbi:MAG: hypothetical protein CMK07_08010 [Ponticaulis sp.]|nr:hypothetical protein [Ponticaulis sp.]
MACAFASTAQAHHGWSTTTDVESKLEGTIQKISFANPHMSLVLETDEGEWEVDLAPPFRARRAGFDVGAAEPGDYVVLTGHRSQDEDENYFKAETITVNGTFYDVYPTRSKTLGD